VLDEYNGLQFPQWCGILELVRTHFGEEFPAKIERLRRKISKLPKNQEKQSARTTFCKRKFFHIYFIGFFLVEKNYLIY